MRICKQGLEKGVKIESEVKEGNLQSGAQSEGCHQIIREQETFKEVMTQEKRGNLYINHQRTRIKQGMHQIIQGSVVVRHKPICGQRRE